MEREREIERRAKEIIESFAKAAEGLPALEETYYDRDVSNVTRPDGEPSPELQRADFRKRFMAVTPAVDGEGNLRVEVAKWVK